MSTKQKKRTKDLGPRLYGDKQAPPNFAIPAPDKFKMLICLVLISPLVKELKIGNGADKHKCGIVF